MKCFTILGPCWLNIKEPKNMETLPLACLRDDLQNDPSVIWKTSAFTQHLRSKFWAVTLLSLPRTSSPHPREENGGHSFWEQEGTQGVTTWLWSPALPPPHPTRGLCLQSAVVLGGWRWGWWRGGDHSRRDIRVSSLPTHPHFINEQSDSILGLENVLHLKCN